MNWFTKENDNKNKNWIRADEEGNGKVGGHRDKQVFYVRCGGKLVLSQELNYGKIFVWVLMYKVYLFVYVGSQNLETKFQIISDTD